MAALCATTVETIRVLLVDDTESVRRALRLMLGAEAGLAIIGEGADGADAVRLATALRPDIIVMDFHLPGMSGIEAARRIAAAGEQSAIIMLTAFGGDEARAAAARAGVALFFEKGDDLDDLAANIRALHARNNPS